MMNTIFYYVTKIIDDGDRSVSKQFKEISSYHRLVEKIECHNHLLGNYMKKLTIITKKNKYPIALRKIILNNLMKFQTTIMTAIHYRKKENTYISSNITSLFQTFYDKNNNMY